VRAPEERVVQRGHAAEQAPAARERGVELHRPGLVGRGRAHDQHRQPVRERGLDRGHALVGRRAHQRRVGGVAREQRVERGRHGRAETGALREVAPPGARVDETRQFAAREPGGGHGVFDPGTAQAEHDEASRGGDRGVGRGDDG
jgi:hypothetical protein